MATLAKARWQDGNPVLGEGAEPIKYDGGRTTVVKALSAAVACERCKRAQCGIFP